MSNAIVPQVVIQEVDALHTVEDVQPLLHVESVTQLHAQIHVDSGDAMAVVEQSIIVGVYHAVRMGVPAGYHRQFAATIAVTEARIAAPAQEIAENALPLHLHQPNVLTAYAVQQNHAPLALLIAVRAPWV